MKVIPLLYLLGAFQGVFLAFSLAGRTYRAGKFLIALLLISSGYFLFEYFVYERYLYKFPHLVGVYFPFLFLVPPLLYQMVRFELDPKAVFQWSLILHLLPFIICLGVMLPYYRMPAFEKLEILQLHEHAYSLYPFSRELSIFLYLLALTYIIFTIRLIKKSSSKKIRWLRNYSILFLALLLVFLISEFIVSMGFHHYYAKVITIAIFSLLIHFIGYSALKETGFMKKGSNQKIPISDEQKQHLKLKLVEILEKEKGFIDSSLTSKELCEKLGTNSKYLSVIVNESFNCSVTSLINSYRVNEAIRMLKDPDYEHLNFLGIATSVGFNNKNSFTRVFRRHTGTNPSTFRGTTT